MKKNIYKLVYVISGVLLKVLILFNLIKVKKDSLVSEEINCYEKKTWYGINTFNDVPISNEYYDLSVIIPVYNSESYLDKCLTSILNQKTKYKYQVICVNDGSTDNSLDILERFQEKYRNLFIISKKNGGISVARNIGIRAASGTYLGFIDNDDWVTNDYVEKLLNRAFQHDADIVKCNHVNYSIPLDCETGVIRHNDESLKKFSLNIMEFKGYIWGGVIIKKLFDKIRFPEGYWYEDIMMRFTLMRMANNFEFIDENLYFYALHKTNASKKLWKKSDIKTLDFIHLLNELCEFNKSINLTNDYVFYNQLVYELGPNLWLRTRKMSFSFRKTLFVYACEMARNYYKEGYSEFYGSNYYISNSLIKGNYLLWVASSFHDICGVHIDYVK